MNFAFDATAILGPMSKNRGIGNYALDLLRTMTERDSDNQYFFLNFIEEYRISEHFNHANNMHDYFFYTGNNHFLINDPLYKSIIGDIIKNFIDEYQIDVFFVTSPFESTVLPYETNWFINTKVVSIVYDIIPYVMKKQYLATKEMYNWYMERVEMLRWMERCLVISQSVKDDMVRLLHFNPEKIDVIYGATSGKFGKLSLSEAQKNEMRTKFHIKSRFIMCTGGDDKRKNMDALITAYAQIPREMINEYQLVIVCRLSDDTLNRFAALAKDHGISGRVVCTNFVTDDELIRLYNMASLMAFPSQYEGFGLPIVEAWTCGVPVLTSKNSSLGEIAGDAAVLVDPYDVDDIARGLTVALGNSDLSALVAKGDDRLRNFTWEKTSDLVLGAMGKIHLASKAEQPAGKRIAFFTPLPPIQSGISDYSMDILNALSAYYEIDVFIDDGYQAKCDLGSRVSVYNHRKFNPNKYQAVLYQVGNSEYHTYMFSYIRRYGGVVELHDENLHLVAGFFCLHKMKDMSLYRKYLLEDYPEETVNRYLSNFGKNSIDTGAYELPLNGFVTNYADKIIVHSLGVKENLLRKSIQQNVHTILHYAKVEPLKDGLSARAELELSKEDIVIAAFGFIQETKRALPLIKALRQIIGEYPEAKLCFVGKPDEPTEKRMTAYIRENGMEQNVRVTGFVELDQFRQYIDATDICVNLRYPYNGETSGSLMRILAKGKCVAVTDVGSFSEIPDECCLKLPPAAELSEDEEVSKIAEALKRLITEPVLRHGLEERAYAYAQQHLDINIIVKQFVRLIQRQQKSSLDGEILANVIRRLKQREYSYYQVRSLASTLAYSKNPDCESGVKSSDIKVTAIMGRLKKKNHG